jgi:uncharacterized protein with FMN-binding domain
MSSKAHYGFIIAMLFVTAFVLNACGQRSDTGDGRSPRAEIDFNDIADGTHRGRFTYGAFNYTVDVVAENGHVVEIIVIQNKDNEPSKNAEAVLERVVELQSLQVDAVTGATTSSKALLQAAENAIKAAIISD